MTVDNQQYHTIFKFYFVIILEPNNLIKYYLLFCRRNMESEEDEETEDSGDLEDWSGIVRKLESQLNGLQTCADVLTKHWKNLAKPLSEMEANADPEALQGKTKEVCERATLFRIATNAMINVCENNCH